MMPPARLLERWRRRNPLNQLSRPFNIFQSLPHTLSTVHLVLQARVGARRRAVWLQAGPDTRSSHLGTHPARSVRNGRGQFQRGRNGANLLGRAA
jgi:hypothetical protein